MTKICNCAVVLVGILSMAYTWPWQEQPKKKNEDMVAQQNQISPSETSPLFDLKGDAHASIEDVSSDITSAAVSGSQNYLDRRGTATSKATDTPGRSVEQLMDTLHGLQTINKLQGEGGTSKSRSKGAPSPGRSGGSSGHNLGVTRITTNDQLMKLPRIQAQINQITRLHDQLNSSNLSRVAELQHVINLTHAHEKILSELEKSNPDKSELTVVEEEEILKQEIIRQNEKSSETNKKKPEEKE